MVTMLMEKLSTGDVIEVKTNRGDDDVMTTLVLLANDEFMILDPCDGTTPFVVQSDELIEYRKFDGA
jgi:3'-phosphoadenosine 5'-phosphosulfate (PAPS) 3'-phosphatase